LERKTGKTWSNKNTFAQGTLLLLAQFHPP
jgi:hypothetical protein